MTLNLRHNMARWRVRKRGSYVPVRHPTRRGAYTMVWSPLGWPKRTFRKVRRPLGG